MFVIHPTRDTVQDLHYETERFCEKYQVDQLPLTACYEIIKCVFDDLLSTRFLWCPSTDRLDEVLTRHIPWHEFSRPAPDDPVDRIAIKDLYYEEILDAYILRIDQWLYQIVPHRTWDVWYLTQLGFELVLDKGPDYRVLDWTRRTESGEWA